VKLEAGKSAESAFGFRIPSGWSVDSTPRQTFGFLMTLRRARGIIGSQ
jgi:hypothetical protein